MSDEHQVYEYTDSDLDELTECFHNAIKVCNNGVTNIMCSDAVELNENGVPVISVHGGLNGRGKWGNYFNNLSMLANVLYTYYGVDCYLIDVNVDTIDDVFDLTFCLQYVFDSEFDDKIDSADLYDISKLAEL